MRWRRNLQRWDDERKNEQIVLRGLGSSMSYFFSIEKE